MARGEVANRFGFFRCIRADRSSRSFDLVLVSADEVVTGPTRLRMFDYLESSRSDLGDEGAARSGVDWILSSSFKDLSDVAMYLSPGRRSGSPFRRPSRAGSIPAKHDLVDGARGAGFKSPAATFFSRANTMFESRRLHRQLLAICVVGMMACVSRADSSSPESYANLVAFDSADLRVASHADTSRLTVELARSTEQQTMGLMERRELSPDAGMLFLYSSMQPANSAFWMFRTRIPLDIAFIDSAGVIRSLQTMAPCTSVLAAGCPSYEAGARYVAALEVNSGYFARKQIRVGDRVLLRDTVTRRPASRSRN